MKAIGWGIAGTGYAASRVTAALVRSRHSRPVAVCSRRPENASAFGSAFGIADVCASFEEMVARPGVDVAYIAAPPVVHRALALKAIERRKAVVIEKPFAMSGADAREVAAAAAAAGVFCMEATWTLFVPLVSRLRETIAAGAIGEIRQITGAFGGAADPQRSDSRFMPEQGGGALNHRCVYPLSLAIALAGEASLMNAAARIGPTGVDEDVIVTLRHHSGALSTSRGSMRAQCPNDLWIEGTHGCIHVEAPLYRPYRMRVFRKPPAARGGTAAGHAGGIRESTLVHRVSQLLLPVLEPFRGKACSASYAGNGYGHEIDEVARCLRAGLAASPVWTLEQSTAVAALMESARNGWTT